MVNDTSSNDDKELIYDLRQIYAIQIVGETLKQIAYLRKTNQFPAWFRMLKRDLRIEISKGLTEKEIKLIEHKIHLTKHIINKFPNEYLGKTHEANAHESIEEALIELEILMVSLMEKHSMFGKKLKAGRI